jgi:transketolase
MSTKMHNPRIEYGKALLELAKKDRNVVALDADLCKSTMSVSIEEHLPEQYVEMGIAEQNMLSTAGGLAIAGKIPFAHTFAVFLTGRAFDQIRQAISIPKLNVKIIGSSAGLSDFGDGATHQTVEDIAIMRAIPNMTVVVPSDGLQVKAIVKAVAEYNGPVYVRMGRNDMHDITGEEEPFEIGKLYVRREGTDVTVFAAGGMVYEALKAAEMLEKDNISVRVVDVPTIKPLDRQAVIDLSKDTGAVVTSEEHSIIGGLGGAIAETLRLEKIPVEFNGINDRFGQSCNEEKPLMEFYKLTSDEIANKIKSVIKLK